jgi:hypothetical protein
MWEYALLHSRLILGSKLIEPSDRPMKAAGTLAARELLARPRRFERPTFAFGAFTHLPTEQYKARCRFRAFRLFKTYARP